MWKSEWGKGNMSWIFRQMNISMDHHEDTRAAKAAPRTRSLRVDDEERVATCLLTPSPRCWSWQESLFWGSLNGNFGGD